MTARRSVIVGLQGLELTVDETALFRDMPPFGFILFARNVVDPDQVRRLVDDLRSSIDDATAPILVDQEGGRVARFRPPSWRAYPPAARLGDLARARGLATATAAASLLAERIALDLSPLGVNVVCAPVLDLHFAGAHDVIGDRAFAADPDIVAALGRAEVEGFLGGGCVPVVKHLPGHGRCRVDSHQGLPEVDASPADLAAADFAPFHALADVPAAMLAHVRYLAIDPERPASCSTPVIQDLVRGLFGFEGLLLTDDLDMGALSGGTGEKVRAALAAGVDLALQCNGDLLEMRAALEAAPAASAKTAARWAGALAALNRTAAPAARCATLDRSLETFGL